MEVGGGEVDLGETRAIVHLTVTDVTVEETLAIAHSQIEYSVGMEGTPITPLVKDHLRVKKIQHSCLQIKKKIKSLSFRMALRMITNTAKKKKVTKNTKKFRFCSRQNQYTAQMIRCEKGH